MTHCWQGINNERQDSAMQRGRRKVPCGGSLALCKDVRASPRPPGPRVQPLCALLLLPVWWERPDPLGNRPAAAPARVARSWVGRGAAAFPARRRVLGWRWPRMEVAGETRRHHSVPGPLSPRLEGTGGAAGGEEGKEGASLSPASRPAGRPGHRTYC